MKKTYFYYRYQEGRPVLNVLTTHEEDLEQSSKPPRLQRHLKREDVKPEQSILSQRRDPDSYPELTFLADQFERMTFYREWNFRRNTPSRTRQIPDLLQDRLLENASNLALVLSDLLNQPALKRSILDRMKTFYPAVNDIVVHISSGSAQIYFHEASLHSPIPATRLSDWSLRYLCLLAVLCHPDPPPVICIEEPEIGLHPDMIPEVTKLLVEASARSQVFVTTHSDILVDALTDIPDAVIVCEKTDGMTRLHRLDAEQIKAWLAGYRKAEDGLGELWMNGEIGGARW